MKIRNIAMASILVAEAAIGGMLTAPARIVARIAEHGTDNVVEHAVTHSADNFAEHVVTHTADDASKLGAKGGAKALATTAPEVARAVDAAVVAARAEARAARPAVAAIHRTPIPKPCGTTAEAAIKAAPKTAVGLGVGVGALVAANNLTAGEREIDKATATAVRSDPTLAVSRLRGGAQWRNILAGCVGAGLFLALLGLSLRIVGPDCLRRLGRRQPIGSRGGTSDGHVTIRGLVLLALFATLALSALRSWRISDGLRKAPGGARHPMVEAAGAAAPDYSAEIRRYNDAVAAVLDRHLRRIGQVADDFENGLREKGSSRFDSARAAIPGIRRSFSSFDAMAGVVKDGAMDKAFGGERLQNRFNEALDRPFIQPCARAGESLVADYETCVARMAAESAAFREEVASAHSRLPEAVRVEFPADSLRASMAKTYGALRLMPLKAGLVAAETAIEVATMRSTVAAARNLALRYGGKAIGKGAAAAVAPAADGPLPIGDAIAVVFAAWTAYDIYDLTGVLPQEIEKSLVGTVNALQTQTIDAVLDAVRRTRAAHEDAARALAAAACAEQGGA